MSAYIIAQVKIHDPKQYETYVESFTANFAQFSSEFKGELLVAEDAPETVEGSWPYTKTVVLRFPSKADAMRWYRSESYQAAVKHRFASAETNLVLVNGLG